MVKSLAIITARGGSKRIPKKNIRNFCGKPIIGYSIEAALESECFNEVMVSTDDNKIAQISKELGAKVPFIRSPRNSDDFSTTADVLLEVILDYQKQGKDFDYICCIYPTAVFITGERLKEVHNIFCSSTAQSLIPVTRFSYPIQRSLKIENNQLKFFWPENINKRSQDLEPSYHDCGQFYFVKTKDFLEEKSFFMKSTIPFEIPESEVQDIDNEEDWKVAEMKFKILK